MFEFITVLLGLLTTIAIILVARFSFRWALAQWEVSKLMRKANRWYHRWQTARCYMVFVDADGIDFTISECEEIHTRIQAEFWAAVAKREDVRFW
jgi:hypothetical protein